MPLEIFKEVYTDLLEDITNNTSGLGFGRAAFYHSNDNEIFDILTYTSSTSSSERCCRRIEIKTNPVLGSLFEEAIKKREPVLRKLKEKDVIYDLAMFLLEDNEKIFGLVLIDNYNTKKIFSNDVIKLLQLYLRQSFFLAKTYFQVEEINKLLGEKNREAEQSVKTWEKKSAEQTRLLNLVVNGRDKLLKVFDGVSEGVYVIDKDYKLVSANYFMANLIGADIEDIKTKIIGSICYKTFFERDGVCNDCPISEIFKSGQKIKKIERMQFGDREMDIEMDITPVLDSLGKPQQAIISLRDIGDRIKLENELKNKAEETERVNNELRKTIEEMCVLTTKLEETKQYNETIIESMTAGVVVLDNDLKIIMFNSRWKELNKQLREESLKQDITTIMSEIDDLNEMLIRLKAEGTFELSEQKLVNPDNSLERYINLKGVALKSSEDQILGYLIVEDDVTKLVALAKEKRVAITEATKKFGKTTQENLNKILEQQLEIQELKNIITDQHQNIRRLNEVIVSLENTDKVNLINENKALIGRVKSLETKYTEITKNMHNVLEEKRSSATRNSKLEIMLTKLSNIEKEISKEKSTVDKNVVKDVLAKAIKMMRQDISIVNQEDASAEERSNESEEHS
ncbi:MAG: PAS domain-containing protein [bacterium]